MDSKHMLLCHWDHAPYLHFAKFASNYIHRIESSHFVHRHLLYYICQHIVCTTWLLDFSLKAIRCRSHIPEAMMFILWSHLYCCIYACLVLLLLCIWWPYVHCKTTWACSFELYIQIILIPWQRISSLPNSFSKSGFVYCKGMYITSLFSNLSYCS